MRCSATPVDASIVATTVSPRRFWTTPWDMSTTANRNEIGSSTRTVVRTRSAQKLPRLRVPLREMPRISATAIAMPAAAETKFCTARPTICVRWLIATSPEYHCQFVFVTKLMATLNAPHGETEPRSVGLKPSTPCARCRPYSASTETTLKASSERA